MASYDDGSRERAARAKVASRRPRMMDPTTCDRDYSAEEWAYCLAVEAFKARTGVRFLTNCMHLQLLKSLGYSRTPSEGVPPCSAD